jgi:tRNA U34 2-thiouridine synthase MnmA/TrmU
MSESIKAVGMLSGGLDSTVATALVKRQGVEVYGVNFSTGFCLDDHRRAGARNRDREKPKRSEPLRAGADLDVPIEIIDISEPYREVVANPKHGYGSAMNPCIDCRAFMFRRAKAYMEEIGAQFVFSGEVLGQRPMSQHRRAMDVIARESGLEGFLVRPLSAKLLDPTEPEKRGWLDREKLGDISGRSRKKQMELAKEFGIEDFPQPAGGCCYLIDENYARKLRDLWEHKGERTYTLEEALLLKVGRHLRLSPSAKLIVGRDESENNFLRRYAAGRVALTARDAPGALALMEGVPAPGDMEAAAGVAAYYSDAGKDGSPVRVEVTNGGPPVLMAVPRAALEWIEGKRI